MRARRHRDRSPRRTSHPGRNKPPSLSRVQRIPRAQLIPGTVVWAHVPYDDGTGEKLRPAVVVASCALILSDRRRRGV